MRTGHVGHLEPALSSSRRVQSHIELDSWRGGGRERHDQDAEGGEVGG